MLNSQIFEDISAKLGAAVNNSPARDIEKNMRALLTQGFSKLDLVTREEFDIQAQVLARAREQLAALEARVTELEAQHAVVNAVNTGFPPDETTSHSTKLANNAS